MNNPQKSSETGLSSAEALKRRATYGPNTIEDEVQHLARVAISKLWAPIPCMLEAAIVFQLVLGEYIQGAVVAFLLLLNATIGFIQESKAQSTLEALKKRLTLSASVCRDGTWITLPAAELVPGDLVTLSLGTVVAADVKVITGTV